jgi:hypothetical protein
MRARHRWRNPDKTTRKKEKHKKETEGEERKKGEHNTPEKTPITNTGKTKQMARVNGALQQPTTP